MRNVPHRLRRLNTWLPVGGAISGSSAALLEGVHPFGRALRVHNLNPLASLSTLACYPASPLRWTGIISQKELFLLKVTLVMISDHRNRTVANTWSYNSLSLLSTWLDLKSPRWDSSGCAWGYSHVPVREDGERHSVMGWGSKINQRSKEKTHSQNRTFPFLHLSLSPDASKIFLPQTPATPTSMPSLL